MNTELEQKIIALAIERELIEGPHNDAQNKRLEAFYKAAQAEALTAAATALEAAIINGDIHLIKHCPDRLREMAKEKQNATD